jgi:hypothetical protein
MPGPPPAQAFSPEGHAHVPALHAPPVGHTVPQLPQSRVLVDVSTHMPLHSVCPVGQPVVQAPFTHSLPAPQRLPQPPQLRGSLEGSTHVPPHIVVPVLHAHALAAQVEPVGQAVPQAPQS